MFSTQSNKKLMTNKCENHWFVIYTKARRELYVLKRLNQLGIEAYTPTEIKTKNWSDRIKKVRVVLLPSMVLVRLPQNEVNRVFQVPEVKRYLFVNGIRAKVFDCEIEAMKNYLDCKFESGRKIKIGNTINIPRLNQKGKIVEVKARKCIVRLQMLDARMAIQFS